VPPGVQPSDVLASSPIFQGEGGGGGGGEGMGAGGEGGGGGGGGGDMFAEYGGIDPSLDPELAMVMRASAEEARQQEEARVSH
jgi:26S proteasome regulatory subunit N10